jgi:hypothetical protein
LGAQIPKLEAWMDERAAQQVPFAVLGDFNRRLFGRENDQVWAALDDAYPPESELDSPTRGQRSTCWRAAHPQYIDHLVLSRTLVERAVPNSFKQFTYSTLDEPHRKQLSDHCPLRITLSLTSKETRATSVTTDPTSAALPEPIKGNISRGGRRLYHTIDCPAYSRVKIDTTRGERYFATEQEAQRAGFGLAPGCRK